VASQISALGRSQLQAWEDIASEWLLIPTWRKWDNGKTEFHFVCPQDNVSVFAASEQSLSPRIFLAATVAHLRNLHREIDPNA
jgi:hypothetical protein